MAKEAHKHFIEGPPRLLDNALESAGWNVGAGTSLVDAIRSASWNCRRMAVKFALARYATVADEIDLRAPQEAQVARA